VEGQFRNKLDVLAECLEVPDAPNFRKLHFEKVRDDEIPPDLMFGLEKIMFPTPWGIKTSLAVSGLKTILDLPMDNKLEKVICLAFAEQFLDGATWTALYEATNDLTAGSRKKDSKLDRKLFSQALRTLVERQEVIDEANGMVPRPKGSLFHLAKVQPVQPATGSEEGDGFGVEGGAVSVGGWWDPKGSPPPPTDNASAGMVGGGVSTDLHRHQPEVEPNVTDGSEATEIDEIVDGALKVAREAIASKPERKRH
jgi:hypothetical protein